MEGRSAAACLQQTAVLSLRRKRRALDRSSSENYEVCGFFEGRSKKEALRSRKKSKVGKGEEFHTMCVNTSPSPQPEKTICICLLYTTGMLLEELILHISVTLQEKGEGGGGRGRRC